MSSGPHGFSKHYIATAKCPVISFLRQHFLMYDFPCSSSYRTSHPHPPKKKSFQEIRQPKETASNSVFANSINISLNLTPVGCNFGNWSNGLSCCCIHADCKRSDLLSNLLPRFCHTTLSLVFPTLGVRL